MRLIYLALALIGTIWPMYYFVSWFRENGWSLSGMVEAWHANASTSGLVWDLTIAAAALTIWVLVEALRQRHYWSLVAIPATFFIGVSCGLPLYLAIRRPG